MRRTLRFAPFYKTMVCYCCIKSVGDLRRCFLSATYSMCSFGGYVASLDRAASKSKDDECFSLLGECRTETKSAMNNIWRNTRIIEMYTRYKKQLNFSFRQRNTRISTIRCLCGKWSILRANLIIWMAHNYSRNGQKLSAQP